ncbi:MAG: hypothetical protein K2M44_07210 [Clostridia bacterium]|nr:hypothetical protein [Clostridia bacterium]
MLLWFEYLLLFFLGTCALLTICYIFGCKKHTVAILCVNSAIGGLATLIPLACSIAVPTWAMPLGGLIGIPVALIYFFI